MHIISHTPPRPYRNGFFANSRRKARRKACCKARRKAGCAKAHEDWPYPQGAP